MPKYLKELSDKMLKHRIAQKEKSVNSLTAKAHSNIGSMGWGASMRGYHSMRNSMRASEKADTAERELQEFQAELKRREKLAEAKKEQSQ